MSKKNIPDEVLGREIVARRVAKVNVILRFAYTPS